MNLVKSVVTVGGFTLISRILGFVRDILIATVVGAGPISDAFFVAFRIPNMFRRLVAEGAFSAAFVPLFSRELEEGDQKTALEFASHALGFLTGFLIIFSALFMIYMPFLMQFLAPGFEVGGDRYEMAVTYTRITFPYLIAMAVVALLGGVLNAFYKFAAMSAAPILLNIILITGLGFQLLHPVLDSGLVLAWGVALAGLAQVIYLIVACKKERVLPTVRIPSLTPKIRRLFRLMLPGLIGAGVLQINILVGTIIASLLATGSISYLYYADRVYQLPLGIIGIAVGTALLPLMTRQIHSGREKEAVSTLNRAVEFSMLLTLPATAALIVIDTPIVSVLFQHGAFDETATHATATALAAFATGLPAYVLTKVFAPGFFSREDTTTPVVIGVIAMTINIALSLLLIEDYSHVGIAIATSVSAWVNAAILMILLIKAGHYQIDPRLVKKLTAIIAATVAMAVVLWFATPYLNDLIYANDLALRISGLALIIASGIFTYFVCALIFKATSLDDFRSMLTRKGGN